MACLGHGWMVCLGIGVGNVYECVDTGVVDAGLVQGWMLS